MRTRSSTSVQGASVYYRYPFNTPPSYGGIQTQVLSAANYCGTSRIITDDPVKGGWEKDVKHEVKQSTTVCPSVQFANHDYWYGSNYHARPSKWQYGLFGSSPVSSTALPKLDDNLVNWDVMKQKAIRQMSPHVNDGLSLINFLLELKDLKRMFHLWDSRMVRDRSDVIKVFRDLAKLPLGKYGKRKTIKNLSDLWLNVNFGWKPFIADIVAMYRALRLTSSKLARIERDAGKLLRRNYSSPIWDYIQEPSESIQSLSLRSAWGSGAPTNRFAEYRLRRRQVYRPTYHATMVYSYTIPEVSKLRRRVDSYLDAFGVKLDPVIIWNAIPFSFVLDWFFDVGSLLRTFTPNDLGIKTTLYDFSHSVKWEREVTLDSRVESNVAGEFLPWHTIYYATERYYERKRASAPLIATSAEWLNVMQASLAGALIISNTTGKRKYSGRISHR